MSEKKARSGKVQTERESFTRPLDKQRALIFQGGAALGAYEAGAYKALYNWIKQKLEANHKDENIFDIIAGTSIGAINAAIIVSHVMENKRQHSEWSTLKCWEGSAEKLEEFWKDTQTVSRTEAMPLFLMGWESWRSMSEIGKSWFDIAAQLYSKLNPFFKHWYEHSNEYFGTQASSEAARRYFSIPEFLLFGARNVFSPLAFGIDGTLSPIALPKMDYKFFNNSQHGPNNLWFRYSNDPLKNILKTKYVTHPIATSESDPRLLVIAVDVQEGRTVAFDSYPDMSRVCKICNEDFNNPNSSDKESNKDLVKHVFQEHRKSRLLDQQLHWSVYGNQERTCKYAIFYDQGIDVEHILASASVPVNYDYTKLEAIEFSRNNEKRKIVTTNSSPNLRHFWDGQYINNTPLRELINEHQRYWIDRIGAKKLEEQLQAQVVNSVQKKSDGGDGGSASESNIHKVPDLAEVYIINLWPNKEKDIPQDRDGQLDRKNDVLFHDKTEYDEKVAELVDDYITLARKLIDDFAPKDPKVRKEVWSFLQKTGASRSRSQKKKRQYKELLKGGFIIDNVVRIERKDDPDSISEKWADYSSGTISRLLQQGHDDTKARLNQEDGNYLAAR